MLEKKEKLKKFISNIDDIPDSRRQWGDSPSSDH
jgi:hypothetical protein